MRRERRDVADRGTSALELAIIAPVLLSLIFFSLQAAFFFYGRAAATHAAREGVSMLRLAEDQADYAALQPDALARTERFAEIVLATSVTVEGDATAHLVAALAHKHGLRASRIRSR